jgi:5-formyltetrahydrofolate cyclo-ligase
VSEIKQRLRQQLRLKRDGLAPQIRDACSLTVNRRLLAWLLAYAPKGSCVALFAPIRNEVDILSLSPELLDAGYKVCLPKVVSVTEIVFTRWDGSSLLTKDRQGILSADGAPCIPDVVCVPLLGFDRRGHRIGYGAGHYDRWLAQKVHRTTVGIAFAVQEVAQVPKEEHDHPLDWVVTEKEIISCQV